MAVSRRLVLAAVTVAVSLALSLIAAEVAVRALHLAPPIDKDYGNYVADSRVPYKFRPFSVTTGVAEYRHNSAGFRDVEHSLEKPPGVFRILGLGDSFTYGALTTFETSYLARLETMLNARAIPARDWPPGRNVTAPVSSMFFRQWSGRRSAAGPCTSRRGTARRTAMPSSPRRSTIT